MGFGDSREVFGFGIMNGWSSQRDDGACGTHTRSRDFVLSPPPVACSAIRRRASSCCAGGQKNDLRVLRSSAERLVRPSRATRPRPRERSVPDLPGGRHSPGRLSPLRHREARTPRLAGGQPVLHQAVRLLRRAALPDGDDQGRGHASSHSTGTPSRSWTSSTCASNSRAPVRRGRR